MYHISHSDPLIADDHALIRFCRQQRTPAASAPTLQA